MFLNILLFFVASQLIFAPSINAECEIEPLLSNAAPLLIGTGTTNFTYPIRGDLTMKFGTGDIIDMACPGGAILLEGNATAQSVVQAECISNARFRINGERFLWRQVTCSRDPVSIGRYTNGNCAGGREAEIGFDLGDGRFVRQIQVCFDATTQNTLFTHYEIPASIGAQATGTPRPTFQQDLGFYNIGTLVVNTLYLRATQRRTINNLIGLNNTSTKYIDAGNLYFLSRGHMAARSDFFYPAQMNASFKYINAAPQWQSFNGFNWNQVEIDTRNYASERNVNLQTWTGVWGVTTLPHETTNQDIPLYIYVNNNVRGIPVPAIYWKVVYNPVTRRGIVLIGLNNPYETNVSKYVICADVSSSVTWLKWNRTSLERGYSYACTIPAFRQVVSYAPTLTVTGLLV